MENRNGGYGEFYRNSVYTWLLCANHLGIHKDVSRLIAKMIPVDLSGWIKWPGHEGLGKLVVWYNPPYEYIYEFKGERFGTAVCPSCLRPCFQSNELTVGSKLQQLRPDIRVYKKYCPVHGEKDFRKSPCQVCSNPQNAANFGVCVPCVNKLCREKNILLHDYVTIADEKFIEECNTK